MTHHDTKALVKKIVLGLAVGTTMMGAVAARAETDATCFRAVVDLYLAERASGSLDYDVCKAICLEAAPADRSACRRACRSDRSSAARESREDADVLRVVCDGGAAAEQRSAAAPDPSTCGPALSECAVDARASAKACGAQSGDLLALSDCAAGVSAAVDRCAADFVKCALPE